MKHAKLLIEDLQTRRRPALGRGLRELLLRGQLSTAGAQVQKMRVAEADPIPEGIPPFARKWAAKVWLKGRKP